MTQAAEIAFASSLRGNLEGWLAPLLVDWAEAAARVFEHQLHHVGGTAHRQVADPLAVWLGMTEEERRGLGTALDLLQVAFDLADNLADAEEDRRKGRERSYDGIPNTVLICLPAYLVATSHEQLARTFAHRPVSLQKATRLVHDVLGSMIQGQGCEQNVKKAELVSGVQARLLCLPAWLCAPDARVTDAMREQLLAWADAWGTSWELFFSHRENPTPASRALWVRSLAKARERWPAFGPFAAGGPLAPENKLPCVC